MKTEIQLISAILVSSSLTVNIHAESPVISDVKGNVYWCAPDGDDETADGTEENPYFDVQFAIDRAQPGDRILMKGGTYSYNKRIKIDGHYGTPDRMIQLWAYDGQAILDFKSMPYLDHSTNWQQGMRLTSSYWHIRNLDFCNASDNGLLIERFRNDEPGTPTTTIQEIMAKDEDAHHNIIEMCNFYRNSDSGLQIKNLGAYNQIINCDSYFNADVNYDDPSKYYGDADGFAPKISCGTGNYFYGCRAWQNSDDGWDSYYKRSNGFPDEIVVILENCITYKNGYLENGQMCSGNGNGFKMGSGEGATNYYLNRCLAVANKARGFDQNNNMGDMILNNCTGFDNSVDYGMWPASGIDHVVDFKNCISIGYSGTSLNVSVVKPAEFINVKNAEELIGPRNPDGSLPETTFAHPHETSSVIDVGVPVETTEYRGHSVNPIAFEGSAPDLGAYEFIPEGGTTGVDIVHTFSSDSSLTYFTAADGTLFLTVENAENTLYCATIHDLKGGLLYKREFAGPTTSVRLPGNYKGPAIITVSGDKGYQARLKAMIK